MKKQLPNILEYIGMAVLVISIGAIKWEAGGIVLAACLIFISFVLGREDDNVNK